ncbi:MAG: hypothetical protein GY796_30610 [Chloroflexi bacterium]|nr:hypothetical protein [Chloroflexota bacterium]
MKTPQSTTTFVVRIRQTWSLDGTNWYGRIEHLQSGRYLSFQNMEKMVDFIHSSGAIENDNWRASTVHHDE